MRLLATMNDRKPLIWARSAISPNPTVKQLFEHATANVPTTRLLKCRNQVKAVVTMHIIASAKNNVVISMICAPSSAAFSPIPRTQFQDRPPTIPLCRRSPIFYQPASPIVTNRRCEDESKIQGKVSSYGSRFRRKGNCNLHWGLKEEDSGQRNRGNS